MRPALGLSEFSFSYMNIVGHWGIFWEGHQWPQECLFYWICPLVTPLPVSTGGFSGRAIMQPWDVVLLDMPSSQLPLLSALGAFLGGPSCGLGCCSIGYALVTPTPHYFSLVCFFPSSPAILLWLGLLLPLSTRHSLTHVHTTRSGSALLTSST